MEATINRKYAEVSSGDDIGLDGIRSGWNGFLQRCEDYWDLFTIWLHRNEPTMPLREFMEEVDEMNKAKIDHPQSYHLAVAPCPAGTALY
ncbi:hypothetical protein AGMMS49965_19970 [Bacteroidia bacterium]|nr:hypothetical protein AGMMS49965_19970 [Bacteroidia bacterium]